MKLKNSLAIVLMNFLEIGPWLDDEVIARTVSRFQLAFFSDTNLHLPATFNLVENSQEVTKHNNQQYGPESNATATCISPATVAVVPGSTTYQQDHQYDYNNQHVLPSL